MIKMNEYLCEKLCFRVIMLIILIILSSFTLLCFLGVLFIIFGSCFDFNFFTGTCTNNCGICNDVSGYYFLTKGKSIGIIIGAGIYVFVILVIYSPFVIYITLLIKYIYTRITNKNIIKKDNPEDGWWNNLGIELKYILVMTILILLMIVLDIIAFICSSVSDNSIFSIWNDVSGPISFMFVSFLIFVLFATILFVTLVSIEICCSIIYGFYCIGVLIKNRLIYTSIKETVNI